MALEFVKKTIDISYYSTGKFEREYGWDFAPKDVKNATCAISGFKIGYLPEGVDHHLGFVKINVTRTYILKGTHEDGTPFCVVRYNVEFALCDYSDEGPDWNDTYGGWVEVLIIAWVEEDMKIDFKVPFVATLSNSLERYSDYIEFDSKVKNANIALKGFCIGFGEYINPGIGVHVADDHHLRRERIASGITKIITDKNVHYAVEGKLEDDDHNKFFISPEVVIIAELE